MLLNAKYLDGIWGPLDLVRSGSPPRTLYHYASPAAVVGILSTKTIWATHHRFFNDEREGKDGIRVVRREIQRAVDSGDLDDDLGPFDRWDEPDGPVGSVGAAGLFVASLTEHADDLAQWRSYCATGGYALGFDSPRLTKTLTSRGLGELIKVIYGESEKRQIAAQLIRQGAAVWRQATSAGARGRTMDGIRDEITNALVTCFCIFKHPSFAAEKEWRIVANGNLSDPGLELFRATRSLIVPYVEIGLLKRNRGLLTQITVGPGPLRAAAREGLSRCLIEHGHHGFSLRESRVPHRVL